MMNLGEQLSEVAHELGTLRVDLEAENVKRDKRIKTNEDRMRTNRIATRAALIGMAIALVVAVGALKEVHDSNAQRARNRVRACHDARDLAIQLRAAAHDDAEDLANASKTPRSDALQKQIDAFIAQRDAHAAQRFPVRDCTPKGIRLHRQSTTTTKESP